MDNGVEKIDMNNLLFYLGSFLYKLGTKILLKSYPTCTHITGISGPTYWCADCGAMRSKKIWSCEI